MNSLLANHGYAYDSITTYSIDLTYIRARLADSKFLFERKGSVTVLVDKGEDIDKRLERLIEAALEAEAEDFDQSPASEDGVEVKVCFMLV